MIKSLNDLNWNQLYYFYEIGRRQSLKKTAEALKVTSPTLSEHIKKLESSLSTVLFKKVARQFVLTEQGQELYWACREIFENGRRIIDSISSNTIGGYAVKVGVQDSLLDSLCLQFVAQYNDLFAPYGTIHTVRENQIDRLYSGLDKGEFDFIISLDPIKSRKTEFEFIDFYTIGFACSKEIYEKFNRPIDIFTAIPLALSNNDENLNKTILSTLADHNIYPEEFIYTDHRDFSTHLAKRGRCITIFPFKQPDSYWENDLKIFSLNDQKFRVDLFATWRKTSSNMVSIQKLKEAITLKVKPLQYNNQDLLLDIAKVNTQILK